MAARLPILEWLPSYDRRWLRGDVAAGIAVTALIVPKDLGYAGIAGVPLQNGLYAAAAGAIIYALFCTSRQISTGPSSSLAAVAGGAVLVAGLADDEAAELVAAITLVSGLLYLAFALLRLGWISRFLSKAVITGFLAGAAVDVVIGELPKLTGTDADGENAWRELGSWIGSLGDVHGSTVLVGVLALGLILGLALPGAGHPGRARPRRRGDPRVARVRPRGARRRARRRRAERAAGARAAELRPGPGAHRDDRRGGDRAAADRVLADRRGRARVRRAAQVRRSTSIRNRWLRAWRTSARASSRACRSRRASPRAR